MSDTAAFYDVDGTLVETNIVHSFAYYAVNQNTLLGSMARVGRALASAPLLWATDKISRKLFNDIFYPFYRGMSQDRLVTLAGELFEEVLKPAIYKGAYDLLQQSRAAGVHQVLVTGALDFTIEPLARHLGVDAVISNQMEFVDGHATGRLVPPLVAGPHKATLIREHCREHGYDAAKSYAYSDSYSDVAMLSAVGKPAAINPDTRLRAVARSYGWPVLELN